MAVHQFWNKAPDLVNPGQIYERVPPFTDIVRATMNGGSWLGPYTVSTAGGTYSAYIWNVQYYVAFDYNVLGYFSIFKAVANGEYASQINSSSFIPGPGATITAHPSMIKPCILYSNGTVKQYGEYEAGIPNSGSLPWTDFVSPISLTHTAVKIENLKIGPYTFRRNVPGEADTVVEGVADNLTLSADNRFAIDTAEGGSAATQFTIDGYYINPFNGELTLTGPQLTVDYKRLDDDPALQSWETVVFTRNSPLVLTLRGESQSSASGKIFYIAVDPVYTTSGGNIWSRTSDTEDFGAAFINLSLSLVWQCPKNQVADEAIGAWGTGSYADALKVRPVTNNQVVEPSNTWLTRARLWCNATNIPFDCQTDLYVAGTGDWLDDATPSAYLPIASTTNCNLAIVEAGIGSYRTLREWGDAQGITSEETRNVDITSFVTSGCIDEPTVAEDPLFSRLGWGSTPDYPTATKTEQFHTIYDMTQPPAYDREFARWLDFTTLDRLDAFSYHLALPVNMDHTAETYTQHTDTIYCWEYTNNGISHSGTWELVSTEGDFTPHSALTTTEDHDFLVFIPDTVADYLDTAAPGWSVTLGSTVLNTSTRSVFYESSAEILTFSGTGFTATPVVSWAVGDVDPTSTGFEPCVCGVRFFDMLQITDTHEYITGPDYSPAADHSTWGQFGPVTAYVRVISSRQTMLDDFNLYFRSHLGAVPGDALDNIPPSEEIPGV